MIGNGVRTFARRAIPAEHQDLHGQVVDTMLAYYHEHCMDETCLYDGISDLVNALKSKGLKIAVVTNKDHHHAESVLDHYFPHGTFDYIVGVDENTPVKPDPKGTIRAMAKLKAGPGECLFVGDSDVDMQTGVNAGMRPIGVTWGFRDKDALVEAGAETVIDSPDELLNLLT
jgi:phosphoglycolate phosphatase